MKDWVDISTVEIPVNSDPLDILVASEVEDVMQSCLSIVKVRCRFIHSWSNPVSNREAKIFMMWNFGGRAQKEIGHVFGLSQARIGQIINKVKTRIANNHKCKEILYGYLKEE